MNRNRAAALPKFRYKLQGHLQKFQGRSHCTALMPLQLLTFFCQGNRKREAGQGEGGGLVRYVDPISIWVDRICPLPTTLLLRAPHICILSYGPFTVYCLFLPRFDDKKATQLRGCRNMGDRGPPYFGCNRSKKFTFKRKRIVYFPAPPAGGNRGLIRQSWYLHSNFQL